MEHWKLIEEFKKNVKHYLTQQAEELEVLVKTSMSKDATHRQAVAVHDALARCILALDNIH